MRNNSRILSVDHASHRLVLSVTVIHRKIALRKLKLCKPRLFCLFGTIFVLQSLRWLKHTHPFSVPLKSVMKQWLFLYLQYKTNSSSATKTPKERGSGTSPNEMPEISCKTCGNHFSSSYKSHFPDSLVPEHEAGGTQQHPWHHKGLATWLAIYLCCNAPGTMRSWSFVIVIYETLVQRNNGE